MTVALASAVNDVDLPAEPGVSRHAVRTVLRIYARIAQHDGGFRFGLRGSRLAELADLSLSTIRRVQRYLVGHGFLEKVQVGGGRASTRWRVVLEKLGLRHGSRPGVTPQPGHRDTAQGREPKRLSRMLPGWHRDRDHDLGRRPSPWEPTAPSAGPSRAAVAAATDSVREALALDWAALAGANAPQVFDTCEHGGRVGLMPTNGLPWCPDCRRQTPQRPA